MCRTPAPLDAGAAHSSWLELTTRAAAVAPLSSSRQRTLADSRNDEPTTARRVPPDTGPDDGATALTHSLACT